MNKEIEETRRAQELRKELTKYVELLGVGLAQKGLSYVIVVADQKTQGMCVRFHGKSNELGAMAAKLNEAVLEKFVNTIRETKVELASYKQDTWENE